MKSLFITGSLILAEGICGIAAAALPNDVWNSGDPVSALTAQEASVQTPQTQAVPVSDNSDSARKFYASCSVSAAQSIDIRVAFPTGPSSEDLGIDIRRPNPQNAEIKIAISLADDADQREPRYRVIQIKDSKSHKELKNIIVDQGPPSGKTLGLGKDDKTTAIKLQKGSELLLDYPGPNRAEFTYRASLQERRKYFDFSIRCRYPN